METALTLHTFQPIYEKGAIISECGLYRYELTRDWEREPSTPRLPIIGLNPSVASATLDDPTIRRCVSFAKRDSFSGITMLNLYAFRATDPEEMFKADDPVGPDNMKYLELHAAISISQGAPILCAWGAGGSGGLARYVTKLLVDKGASLVCLGLTKQGHPRHPLYVKGDTPFSPYLMEL